MDTNTSRLQRLMGESGTFPQASGETGTPPASGSNTGTQPQQSQTDSSTTAVQQAIVNAGSHLQSTGDAATAIGIYNQAASAAGRPRISSVHPMAEDRWLLTFETGSTPWVYDAREGRPYPLGNQA